MNIWSRKFLPFCVTQFLGALNDNLYRGSLLIGFTFGIIGEKGMEPATFVTLAGGIFILPFFLFSPLAGRLGDVYDKTRLIRLTKILELLIVFLIILAFIVNDLWFLLAVLFLLGVQSAFFGPMKYSILSHHIERGSLNEANGVIVFSTFISILLGTILGNAVILLANGKLWLVLGLFSFALVGVVSSFFIPDAPPYDGLTKKEGGVVSLAKAGIADMRVMLKIQRISRLMLANSWFWGIGSLIVALLAPIALRIAGDVPELVNLLFLAFIAGIGFGIAMMRMCKNYVQHPNYLLICLGLICLLLIDVSFALFSPLEHMDATWVDVISTIAFWRVTFDLFFLAACGGAFCVPLYTELQLRSKDESRSQVFATTNVLNAIFIVVMSLCSSVLFGLGLGLTDVLLVFALANAVVAIWCFYRIRGLDIST